MNEEKVLKAIQFALDMQEGSITLESSSENTEGWDSLGQLSILQQLDKLFEGKIAAIEEMASADSVVIIKKLLQKHSLI
jgi:acyl carrier protein